MSQHKESVNFLAANMPFIIFLLFLGLIAWNITSPVVEPLLWAAVLSFISRPLYRFVSVRFLHKRFPSIAAAITLVLLIILCVVPVLYAFSTLKDDAAAMAATFYQILTNIQQNGCSVEDLNLSSWLPLWAVEYINSFLENSESVKAILQPVAQWSAKSMSTFSAHLIEQASGFILNVVITMMVSFFFIRDGAAIVNYIKSILPLSSKESNAFVSSCGVILNSIVYGIILTVAIQALAGGLGWWFVGLKSPVLFALLMFFFGMFPAGTAVVWVPGSIYLAVTGDLKNAAILFIWGAAFVGTIDNMLRPFLISSGGQKEIPTLLITVGLFGGVLAWGFLGIFFGPFFLVLFLSVCDIYRKRWQASLGDEK